jgi:protein translocase SecG subunit
MIFTIIQIISAVLLIASVLVQHRGSGLGVAFGGSDTVSYSRRGAEKFLFYFTIVCALVFLISSLLSFIY